MGRKIDINEAKEPAPGRVLIVGGGLAGSCWPWRSAAPGATWWCSISSRIRRRTGRARRSTEPDRPAAPVGRAVLFRAVRRGPGGYAAGRLARQCPVGRVPVLRIETCEWLQEVETVGGERVLGRLLVLATGVEAPVQAGVVTIGDAFGSGLTRMLNDVRLLSRTYIPRWLVTPGMHRSKVAAF